MSDSVYQLENIKMIYDSRSILNIPRFDIKRGEVFTFVGPSGAGKSTLLRLLAFIESPTAGKLHLCTESGAVSYENVTQEQKRDIIMIFQRPALMSRSVRYNIAYPLRLRNEQNVDARVDAILERIAMTHLASAKPATLSSGELQRVSIARALVLQPKVMLLDEPTANLDPYNVRIIEQLLSDYAKSGKGTIILVTHNVFQARRLANRVGLMLNGELVEVAETEKFFDNPDHEETRAFVSGDLIY